MTKSATTVNATCNVGQYMYDPVTKVRDNTEREYVLAIARSGL